MNNPGQQHQHLPDAGSIGAGIEVRVARRLDDFWHAMRLIRMTGETAGQRRRRPGIGEAFSRWRHGGSGPGSGCLLIARQDGKPVGCIALLIADDGTARTDWLTVRDPDRHGAVAMVLVRRAYEQAKRWGVRRLSCEPAAAWDDTAPANN